jgi:hypothetical protein
MERLSIAAFVFAFAWAVAASAVAAPRALSGYEKESIRFALDEVHGELDPSPEGKSIESIEVVTLEVFEPRDPLPGFLNVFHATTRPDVVKQEVLLHPGERYDAARVEESERNLRERDQLSVVLIVPAKGSTPDRVRLVVVTKDVWSLRVNYEPLFVNGKLQAITFQPSEMNLFGRHKILYGNVEFGRATYVLGLGYTDPRIGGSRLQTQAEANLIFNCETNQVEGSTGTFSFGRPLYSTRTKWSWVAAASWEEGITRPAGTVGQSICAGRRAVPLDIAATRAVEAIPYQYRTDVLSSELAATRSFGILHKYDVAFGVEVNRQAYTPPDLAAYSPVVRAAFDKILPVSDTRLSPFVQLHAYETRFQRVIDSETLGLQEDYRLGHDVWLRAYPAARALGSTRNLLGIYGGLGYTLGVGDGLARAYATNTIELSRPDQTDGALGGGLRFVTPTLPFGRVVLDGQIIDRYENYLNPVLSLGGTTRLRGYRTSAFVGPNLVVGNVEVRSRPVEILSVQVGAVAFFDVGDAFRDFDQMQLKRGVGGGLRFAFPQVQRTVLRIDVGVPLDRNVPGAETSIVARFEQAFPMPALETPGLVQ